jgi:DNA-binding protein H-NS
MNEYHAGKFESMFFVTVDIYRSEVTHAEVCESQEPEIRAKKHRKAKKQAPKRKDVAVIDENPSGMSWGFGS